MSLKADSGGRLQPASKSQSGLEIHHHKADDNLRLDCGQLRPIQILKFR